MTTIFWFIVATLIAGSVVTLVRPLLKSAQQTDSKERDKALSLSRQQFEELSQDLQSGAIGQEQYEQACRELERRLSEESGATETVPLAQETFSRRLTIGTIAVCLPIASVLLYAKLGNPLAIPDPVMPEPQAAGSYHMSAQGIDLLAERLKRKLERKPDDGPGWALLARSYIELDRYAESVPAFENAVELIENDAQLLADYADALGALNGRRLDGRPTRLIHKALAIEPNNPKALLLAATVAVQTMDYPRAIQYWERVLVEAPPGSALAAEVRAHIAEARGRLGNSQNGLIAREQAPRSAARPAISGVVKLAPNLADQVAPTDVLFVFARAADGPPMPVAVVRASPKDLPFSFRLDDSHSVMPGRRLSEAGTVVVVARLSGTGTAMPESGDLQGTSGVVTVGQEGVTIILDTELP